MLVTSVSLKVPSFFNDSIKCNNFRLNNKEEKKCRAKHLK